MEEISPAELMLTILFYTQGRYSPEEVEDMYCLLTAYIEEDAEEAEKAEKSKPNLVSINGSKTDAE